MCVIGRASFPVPLVFKLSCIMKKCDLCLLWVDQKGEDWLLPILIYICCFNCLYEKLSLELWRKCLKYPTVSTLHPYFQNHVQRPLGGWSSSAMAHLHHTSDCSPCFPSSITGNVEVQEQGCFWTCSNKFLKCLMIILCMGIGEDSCLLKTGFGKIQ